MNPSEKSLDMDLFWEKVNQKLDSEIMEITQKIHFYSQEILDYEKNSEKRPDDIGMDELKLALSEGYCELGMILVEQLYPDLGHIAFLYSIQLDVRNFISFHELGKLAMKAGNYQFAERSFKIVLDLSPEFEEAAFSLAKCHLAAGDRDLAYKIYQKIPPGSDQYGRAQCQLLQILMDSGQREKGLEIYEGHRTLERIPEKNSEMEKILGLS